ncbi:MAG TPA: hypothetical protein VGD56_11305 [Gemmatirosa sp.]
MPHRSAARTFAAAALAATAACVPASQYHEPRPALGFAAATDARGADTTAAALAGDWAGQFDAPYYARRGALRLSLRRVVRADGRTATTTVAGTATLADGTAPARVAIDSARVARGRVVFFFEPFADQETGATIRLRLDGALAADTLGGRLRADAAATVAPERRGGWRVVRVATATMAAHPR